MFAALEAAKDAATKAAKDAVRLVESDETKMRRAFIQIKIRSGLGNRIWRNYRKLRMRPIIEIWKFEAIVQSRQFQKGWKRFKDRSNKKRKLRYGNRCMISCTQNSAPFARTDALF